MLTLTLRRSPEGKQFHDVNAVRDSEKSRSPSLEVRTCERSEYMIHEKIGEGSFAIVYRATERNGSNRKVAIKVIKSEHDILSFNADINYVDVCKTALQEIKAMEEIGHHPNIVELLAKDIVENVAVMEQGSSDLSIIVKKCREKGLPAHLVQAWTIGVCAGVSFIHEQGFIHQDLKSPNILVFNDANDLNVKLCDFGLARRMSSGNGMLRVDRVVCTLWTRAPELLMCESSYSKKIDDWSVGCIILEMIMGRSPFRGDPQYACSCSQDSHLNFNSDQIGHIFRVLGSPTEAEAKRTACYMHIRGWPKVPRTLEQIVATSLDSSRFRNPNEKKMLDDKFNQLLSGLLHLHPEKRWTSQATIEYLQRDDAQFTTQFTCFTSTKVQTLTPEELLFLQATMEYLKADDAQATEMLMQAKERCAETTSMPLPRLPLTLLVTGTGTPRVPVTSTKAHQCDVDGKTLNDVFEGEEVGIPRKSRVRSPTRPVSTLKITRSCSTEEREAKNPIAKWQLHDSTRSQGRINISRSMSPPAPRNHNNSIAARKGASISKLSSDINVDDINAGLPDVRTSSIPQDKCDVNKYSKYDEMLYAQPSKKCFQPVSRKSSSKSIASPRTSSFASNVGATKEAAGVSPFSPEKAAAEDRRHSSHSVTFNCSRSELSAPRTASKSPASADFVDEDGESSKSSMDELSAWSPPDEEKNSNGSKFQGHNRRQVVGKIRISRSVSPAARDKLVTNASHRRKDASTLVSRTSVESTTSSPKLQSQLPSLKPSSPPISKSSTHISKTKASLMSAISSARTRMGRSTSY